MHTHGLGLYGQGSSRLDVEPQYIMSRAGFIPPRRTHVCCAVWCVPASCPTRSFGPLPPATCLPPGGCVLRGIFALPFFVRRKLGVLCASASKSSKQIRRAVTAMHRKVWGCRVGRSAVCPAQGQTERAHELREARLHRGQARARGDRTWGKRGRTWDRERGAPRKPARGPSNRGLIYGVGCSLRWVARHDGRQTGLSIRPSTDVLARLSASILAP